MPAINILVVNYKHKPGGYSYRLQMKIEAYLEQGWTVHYIAVEPYPYKHKKLIPHILPLPFKRHDTPWFWASFFLLCPLYALYIGKSAQPKLISVFSPPYAWICGLLKKYLKIPIVIFLRTIPNDSLYSYKQASWANKIEHRLNEKGIQFANMVIANSNTVLKKTKEKYRELTSKEEMIPNHLPNIPVDRHNARVFLNTIFGIKDDEFIVTTTGRFHKGKNIEILFSTLSRIENKRVKLLLLGDGEEVDELKALAREMQQESRIIFSGWRDDIPSLLPGTDLFVLPSLKEGMSNSLLEAMACEVPCFVSEIPENQEVISRHDQQFPPHDSERLAHMINRAIDEKYYYEQICKRTNEDADRFRFDWKARVIKAVQPLIKK